MKIAKTKVLQEKYRHHLTLLPDQEEEGLTADGHKHVHRNSVLQHFTRNLNRCTKVKPSSPPPPLQDNSDNHFVHRSRQRPGPAVRSD